VAELGFVVAIAIVTLAVAIVVSRGAGPLDLPLVAIAGAAIVLGAVMMRLGAAADLRARATCAIAAFVFGLGNALLCAALHQRVARGPSSLSLGAAAAVLPLSLAGLGAAVVVGLASPGALATMMFGWAVGGVLGTLLSGSGNAFPLVALVTAASTVTCANVAARNLAALRDVGPRVTALVALAPLLTVLSCVAVFVGVMSVRSEGDDAADAPLLRGFAVASIIATLSAIAASHWWARPAGRGAWLALAPVIASIASTIVLLVGRYYDDPLHRAARAVARAQRGGPRTRLRTGLRFGTESAGLVLAIAIAASLSSKRVGDALGVPSAGWLAIAITALTALAARGYLDALAISAAAGEARTLAHDLFIVATATVLLAGLYASVALVAVLVAAALTTAAVIERVAAAHGDEGELRRRAAVLPVVAAGLVAASALFEAVLA